MDQDKVNPFVSSPDASAGGTPSDQNLQAAPAMPVNPYAPAGAPYAPGSNTPAPAFANQGAPAPQLADPAVPNTAPRFSNPDPAYTSISPAPSVTTPAPDKPKFFTKKFIIFASVGLILIVAAVVAGTILQGSRGGNSSDQSSGNTTFNSYMNYILTGSQSGAAYQSEYNIGEIYYIEKAFSSADSFNRSVAGEIATNWDKVYTSLSDTQKNSAAVEDYNALVEVFRLYSQVPPLSDEALLSAYTSGSGKNYLTDYYSAYDNGNSVYAKSYGKILVDQGEAAFAKYQIYSREGCLPSGALDEECISMKILSEEDQATMFSYNQLTSQERVALADYTSTLVTSVWDVKRVVNGEEQS
ncbi:hypothetical protein IJ103_00410 [Candidatus Saccharibacteria bacterium]|nr:hypothetical protein [Candidatus Saccharibacteria bacterium]